MMMTQSFYGGGGDLDTFHRTHSHRNMSNGAYFDRAGPYANYEPRHGLRHEYAGRIPAYTMIQEPEGTETAGGQARRRIAVACSRCRRRKIKCSGDPGDGTGCLACRNSGANVNDCNFNRVGSEPMPLKASLQPSDPAQYGMNTPSSGIDFNTGGYQPHHRPSLPTLHTRSSYPSEYNGHYGTSPVDAYTYGADTVPRQESYASSYGSQDSYRNYSTSGPLSAPATAPFYDQQNTYSFGSLQTPIGGQTSAGRLPSVTAEAMSALNMGSLHSSLPVHTPAERRLPVPYTIQYPQPSFSQQNPELRALDQAAPTFRPSITASHSRNWLTDSSSLRSGSIGGMQSQPGAYSSSGAQNIYNTTTAPSSASIADPVGVLGYVVHQDSPYSGDGISPTTNIHTATTLGEHFPNATIPASASTSAMPPPPTTASLRYRASDAALPALTSSFQHNNSNDDATTRRHHEAAASLYSFSADSTERADTEAGAARSGSSADAYANIRHPQPQHAASFDGLRRQSEYDEQRAEAAAASGLGSRISMRSLNGRY